MPPKCAWIVIGFICKCVSVNGINLPGEVCSAASWFSSVYSESPLPGRARTGELPHDTDTDQILSVLKCFSFFRSEKAAPNARGVLRDALSSSFANFFDGVCCSFRQSMMLTERACVYNILISLMDSREKGKGAGVFSARLHQWRYDTWQYLTRRCY